MGIYYHGSENEMELGTWLFPNYKGYTHQKAVKALEDLFEEEKPEHIMFSRRDCVFMTDSERDIDNVGGNTDFIYRVDTDGGPVEASDMSWYSLASCQLSEGNIQAARESARKYWAGDIHEGVMEYRTDEAEIIDEVY